MDKLDYLINYLLSERNDIGKIEIPKNEADKFRLYRSLVNIRPGVKADEDFLQAEDEYLTALTESKGITVNESKQNSSLSGQYLTMGQFYQRLRF